MFRIGVRVLSETLTAEEAGRAYSSLASLLLARLHAAVTADLEARHGRIAGGASCIVAMGKLGGREMTASSDLDLMVVYDADETAELSDGAKPLSVSQYYARLTQRLITAISAPTSEGVLYDVDMRLRPSGSKGPVAASFASFVQYQAESAWTWEKLALTRARVVAGDATLADRLTAAIRASLTEPRDAAVIRKDVLDMRKLMLAEHQPQGVWDIKRCRGGLVELEFLAQFLQLVNASKHPDVLSTNTFEALQRLAQAELLQAHQGQQLREACQLLHRLTQITRLAIAGNFDPAKATSGLREMVARAAAAPDLAVSEALLAETEARVAGLFDEIIGAPA
jgi:glutamate-ammonia-ligase adenylyltransferase